MARKAFNASALLAMLRILCTKICNQLYIPKKSNNYTQKFLPFPSNLEESPTANQTLVFDLEGVLLKSCSIFPYFMLVAFEAGGPSRALILLLVYPFVCLVGEDLGLKIMVFVCFVGIKVESFRVGRAVLPKFFLENVGKQGFDMVMKWKRKVGLTNMPRVMVEGFLRDHLEIEHVLGRELKLCCGFFVGLMEEKGEKFGTEKMDPNHVIGLIGSNSKSFGHELASQCKGIYWISEAEKRTWEALPRKKFPKPLIFHDGRLAFSPTPLTSFAMFMWIPFGFFLFLVRSISGILLPYKLSLPILSFTGMQGIVGDSSFNFNTPSQKPSKPKGRLYVCNHRTLLDPLIVSVALMKPLTAVTYSLSKVVELFSPIKTIRLTRNRDTDSKKMEELLSQGDLVVCPEGTTCREPYLLRFSPLFAELSDEIVPIAIDLQVSMFYGTTAAGLKCLDPVLLLVNPTIICWVKVVDKLAEQFTCGKGGKSKFEVANHVQSKIAKALDFECTNFTRKDKYILLAGNEGVVKL